MREEREGGTRREGARERENEFPRLGEIVERFAFAHAPRRVLVNLSLSFPSLVFPAQVETVPDSCCEDHSHTNC